MQDLSWVLDGSLAGTDSRGSEDHTTAPSRGQLNTLMWLLKHWSVSQVLEANSGHAGLSSHTLKILLVLTQGNPTWTTCMASF